MLRYVLKDKKSEEVFGVVLPRVKECKINDNSYIIPFEMKITVKEEYKDRIRKLTELFFQNAKPVFGDSGNIVIVDNCDKTEKYSIEISESGINIECGNYLALRNAFATLAFAVKPHSKGYIAECCAISDEPSCGFRGIMLDLARGAKPYGTLIEDIILCGKLKYNVLHLHLFDSEGLCVKLDSVPEVCCVDNYYSKEQMKNIVQLAEVLGLEIIPEWDMPGHSSSLFMGIEGMECDIPEESERFVWAACVGKEKTYEVYEAIIKELVDLFPGRFFHIGGDEVHFEDGRPYGYICHWMECADCRRVMEENGLKDIFDLYNYFVLRIYKIVKKTGRTMMMWSDWLDCTKPGVLPKDIIMHFWRTASEGRGPYINSSMNNQLKMGYKVINSYYEDTYFNNELYISTEKLPEWSWLERPETDKELKGNILGSTGCCWEYGNLERYPHYDRTFAPTAVLFADKLWNDDKITYDNREYIYAVNKTIFGISTPDQFDVFVCIGNIIPPRETKPRFIFAQTVLTDIAYFDRISCTGDEVRAKSKVLRKMASEDPNTEIRVNYFADFLERIAARIDENS